jgi:flavin reductase (DIM6/NTAB) family NADH-FMN oxidoreductase RutF
MRKIDPQLCYRLLYPTIPVIVTSKFRNIVTAMPAVSYMMVSNNPAIIGLCIQPTHTTYEIIKKAKKFAFTWISKEDRAIIDRLVMIHGYEEGNKLRSADIHYFLSRRMHLPIPNNSVAYIETKLIKRLEVGDHVLLLSKVITCFAIEDFENYWKFKKYKPLLYIGMQNGARFYDQVKVR